MPYRHRHHAPTALSIVAVLVMGCGDDTTEPQTGNIQASIIIDGAAPDPDGCLVSVDGGDEQVLSDGEGYIFGGLSTGTHTVAISDVAFNCFVQGESSQSVNVSANQTSFASFTVDCPAPGRIQVATSTAGSSPFDPDGYTVALEGGTSLDIGVSDAVTFPDLAVGEYRVELTGVADNCSVFAENPRTVAVTEGKTTAISFGVACPPFYDYIAFTRVRGNADIWVMRADGSNPVNLTNGEASDWHPSWSPDGREIAFSRGSEIYVIGDDHPNPVNLTNHEADDSDPVWSPDGSRIAFATDRDGNREIYVMNSDGSNPINLTNHEAMDIEPAWSPDGNRIAFTTWRDGEAEADIYLTDADGSNTTNITNDIAMHASEPDWSPDGTQIVFWTYGGGTGSLYVMGADGSNPTHVITQNCMSFPAWSPDGLWIAFSGYCGSPGGYEIMMVQVDGSNLTNLTNHGGLDSTPAWSPSQ